MGISRLSLFCIGKKPHHYENCKIMEMEKGIFNRTKLLVGEAAMDLLSNQRVIVFGVGGVGSWCAESLVRSGIKHLTIVDSDCVCITNVNRQLMATTQTIGRPKVEVLKARLLEISPSAEITALQKVYQPDTCGEFQLDTYDYIIDAIDSLSNKAHLILEASQRKGRLFSSMGAALKMDPTAIKVAEFWNVRGCPLGSALRKKMKKEKTFPKHKFLCVYSEELLPNQGEGGACGTSACVCSRQETNNADWNSKKAQVNGTMAHITAIFGFTLAGLVCRDIWRRSSQKEGEDD